MLISVDTFSTSARSLGGSVQFFCVDFGGAGVPNRGDGRGEKQRPFQGFSADLTPGELGNEESSKRVLDNRKG